MFPECDVLWVRNSMFTGFGNIEAVVSMLYIDVNRDTGAGVGGLLP